MLHWLYRSMHWELHWIMYVFLYWVGISINSSFFTNLILYIMSENLKSRREFFKKSAQTILPILAAIVLSDNPVLAETTRKEWGCDNSCSNSCKGSCKGGCQTSCAIDGCGHTCSGSCRGKCNYVCKDSCYNDCTRTSKR